MMRRALIVLALTLPLLATDVGAQAAKRRQQRLGTADNPPARQQLELRLRQGLWRVAKNRIGFSEEQMSRLTQTSQRFDVRRRELARDERQQRLTLRRETLAGATANQNLIGSALDRVLQLQRARVDLQIEEQREFAAFMTPLQRAKYAALQEQVRRRVQKLQQQRADTAAASDSELGAP